ncbi:gamma-glutamyl hydrolase 2 isoform X2 [Beta vulgaris subsp. vulgaris]|uniref:gamma-glutamyl hydrolase 2 isoform X2 n=1 Tax=Beta vulgaris subsp. vulgaris TaxID=3555 RepID=UPI002036CDF4|nr:gamma-glutamyl hydrolase 2 isoform X2 [Beta vulgaris subsp. vulgaris]
MLPENTPSSSSSCLLHSNLWFYLWIPLLTSSLSKRITLAEAHNINTNSIMLPIELDLSSPSSSYHHHFLSPPSPSPRCSAPDSTLNFRPVIGILSHPGDGASGRLKNGTNVSYIASSYVKFVESAGARVIPLIYTDPLHILLDKLELVNGVLFTGGWAKRGLYFEVVREIFKRVLEKNDAGQFFPCYAICLGFELLTMIISKDNNILESFSASYQPSTLQFVKNININGTVFQRFPPELLRKLNTDCLVMQNHKYGLSPETLQGNQRLSSFFNILTTSTDRDDKVYVSTVQAQHYPITAFQWHPEKNAFEWGYAMIPHSEDAIQVTQHVANSFIRQYLQNVIKECLPEPN